MTPKPSAAKSISSTWAVSPDGTKQATNVYAGGALIAKQKRHVAGGVNYDSIEWRTADPVTGTVARFDHASGGLTMTVENYEPLGQRLYPNDPEDYEPPTGSFGLNNADYPEWMCEEATAAFIWGDFAARPWACQRKYIGGEDRYGRYSTTYRIDSPQKVGRVFYPAGHAPAGSDTGLAYTARQLRQDTITATAKDDSPGTCDWDKDGRPNCNVSVNPSSIDLADTGWTEPGNTAEERRRASESELATLKKTVTAAADNSILCRQYIEDLVMQVAKNAEAGLGQIVGLGLDKQFSIEELFDTVSRSRVDWDPSRGGIYFSRSASTHTGSNLWWWVGNAGYAEINMSIISQTRSLESRLNEPMVGMLTIHELLHVAIRTWIENTTDLSYAIAVAELAGETPPVFKFDENKPVSDSNRPVNYQASEYWGERLMQACGFPSHITGKFTSYRLYGSGGQR